MPELIPPLPAPAGAERPAPSARSARNDGPRFSDNLENERAERAASSDDARRSESRHADAASRDRNEAQRAERSSDSDDTVRETARDASAGESDIATADASEGEPVETVATGTDETVLPDEQAATDILDDVSGALAETAQTQQNNPTGPAAFLAGQSAEALAFTPPMGMQQAEPGALARWFAKVTAPSSSAPLGGQSMGNGQAGDAPGSLLNRLASQTSSQALNGAGAEGAMAGADAEANSAAATPSFADAMANSASDGESLDMALSQALAKASPNPDTQTGNVPTITTGQTLATGAQAAMTAVPQAATGQAVPVTVLAVEITRQAMNGKTQFDIRLDPPELGRLSVRLEMDASGQTRTHMVVERSETLDMLATDARSLERALQQAGLKAEPGSVSFELAQDAADGFSQGQNSSGTDDEAGTSGPDTGSGEADPTMGDELASPEAIRQHLHVTGHLDVRI